MAGALAASMTTPGQAAEQLSPALEACRAQKDDSQRLACYDRVLDTELRPTAASAELPAAAPAAGTATAEERFGQEGPLYREVLEKTQKIDRELAELHSKVAILSMRPDGALVITLENGQVWGQKSSEPSFRLKIGEPVRIKRAAMGSFILYGDSKWSTRVTRLP
jgi:hypothetical protein